MQAAGPDPWPGGCECGGGDTMNALAANDIEAPRSDRAELQVRLGQPPAAARFLGPATGAGLGRLAGRAIPARRDQPTARLHRQPVPATLTTTPCHQGSSGNWTLYRY